MKKRYFVVFLIVSFFFSTICFANEQKVVKVACVGNSITYGAGIKNRHKDSYPSVLSYLLGEGYEVKNFGYSARTLLMKGDYPYMKEQMYQDALNYLPDIVTIKLGTNDTKPLNWRYQSEFKKDLEKMIGDFQKLSSKPQIYLCLPVPPVGVQWGINDSIVYNGVIPIIRQVAKSKNLPVIDLYSVLKPFPQYFPDRVHPNPAGAALIAQAIYKGLTGKEAPKYDEHSFPGKKSEWEGYNRYDFSYLGRDVIVVEPKKAAPGKPWIWRPAFFDAFPYVDKAILKEGFHVVYFDVTHLYGSPHSVQLGNEFFDLMTQQYGFSSKVTLEGLSRGGLFAYNWAARNTDKVACIYVDAPVCDILSWPSRKDTARWNEFLKEWNIKDEEADHYKGNPIDNVNVLIKAGIPVLSVCGDSDTTVPYVENSAIMQKAYRAAYAPMEVILKPGVEHHPHSLENPERILRFILRYQPGYTRYQHVVERGSLSNSFLIMEKERKARVAFLGGSITEMDGWRNYVEESLRQRFPYTNFEFVEAGVASTGTTPGAFRLENDILSKGKIDLLFVEGAVNDHTNGFNAVEQVRGMEGEIRHALMINPNMDIVMLHFVYDPFISMISSGRTPDVILNHERVANHYLIPSVNLAQEIVERINAGEFDWTKFGGTHPSPFGHAFYAAAVSKLLDDMWGKGKVNSEMVAHELPEPLDSYSYYGGSFVDIKQAELGKGWTYEADWAPKANGATRTGFVHVPMLEATQTEAKLTLNFIGKAIGIYCVAGPQAAVLEYSVDGKPFRKLDTYTVWSQGLYIPWLYLLESELENTSHKLVLRIAKEQKENRTACQIRNFVINK